MTTVTPALSRPEAGQDLHLNRAMLSDQGSPYVGRFARGWRRLPGSIPGQPQTRTRARSSIGTRGGARERPSGREQMHRDGASLAQRLRGCRSGRAGRQDVVDEQYVTGDGHAIARDERTPHRRATFRSVTLGLRSGGDRTAEQSADR